MALRDLPASAYFPLTEVCATARTSQPIYAAVVAFCEAHFGFKLLTILRHLPETAEIARVYSSNLEAYPVGGRKTMGGTPWGDVVLKAGTPWLGNGAEDMRWAYPDAEKSLAMGRESSFCAPVRFAGETLGVLNMSAARDSYDFADAPHLQMVSAFLVQAFMMDA
ncbi:MAG: hypothetical protein EP318_07265 [Rhodobacteraceae bacterium]|nr:MAG: hypothetical protein EP318_07265 [Paracoccaceae bacterium]